MTKRRPLSEKTKAKIGMSNHLRAVERQYKIGEKFWSKVLKTDSCWLWTGKLQDDGYAKIGFKYKTIPVHRMAWMLIQGIIPEGLIICHRCDIRHCVNPEHLFIVTQRNNIRDASIKGRLITGDRHHMRSNAEIRERIFALQRGVSVPSRGKYGPRPEWIKERMRQGWARKKQG